MKNMIKKIMVTLVMMVMVLSVVPVPVHAAESTFSTTTTKTAGESLDKAGQALFGLAKPIGAFVVFGSVLLVGFALIGAKDKADERTKLLQSLMWVGIGSIVIGSSIIVASFLWGQSKVESSLQHVERYI